MVWHVLVAVAFCGFIVLPFLHNAIDKTLGQWLWYPCLVVFLGYSFIPNKKMKEQSKFVQISSSGGILQLLFIISGILVINYYDTDYNWYWFAFVLIALSIPIGCVTVKAWAESKNTYSTEQVKAANVRLGKYIMFYWLLDLFYMACFNQWLVLQFVFGGLAMLIVFYSLTVAFLSEIKTNKWLTYIEMFSNIEVGQKPVIISKSKFKPILKALNAVKNVPQSIKSKFPDLNKIGIGKKVQRLLKKYKIDYDRYKDVFTIRGKVVHGALVDIEEMHTASEQAKELLTILTLKKLNYVGYIRNFTNNNELILVKDMSKKLL